MDFAFENKNYAITQRKNDYLITNSKGQYIIAIGFRKTNHEGFITSLRGWNKIPERNIQIALTAMNFIRNNVHAENIIFCTM